MQHEKAGALDVALVENESLTDKLKELGLALEAKGKRLRSVVAEISALRKESERKKKSAKFDLVAREGQTKKLGILEHTVGTLRHDLHTNVEHREKLEGKVAILERSWQTERSLRLQDLHRHDAMSSDTKRAEKFGREVETESIAVKERSNKLKQSLETKARELEMKVRLNKAQVGEINDQEAEIESRRHEILCLKRTLITRDKELSMERMNTSKMRRELSRVRREFIMSTFNRSEQQRALLGGRRQSNCCQRFRTARASVNDNSSTNALALGIPMVSEYCNRQGVSRFEASALEEARSLVSLDGVFISRLKTPPTALTADFGGDGLNETRGSGNERGCRRSRRSTSPGRATPDTDTRGDNSTREKINSNGRRKQKTVDLVSTLMVPGSLYLGTGLGLKKTPTWAPPVGSAKDTLKKIMEVNGDGKYKGGISLPEERD